MKVLVMGAGALGSLFGAFLADRHAVTLVGRAPHVDAVRRDGLQVEGIRTMHVRPEAKVSVDGTEGPELVIVAVKAYDTRNTVDALRAALLPRSILVTIQNGLGNYELLRDTFPEHPVLGASVTYGATLTAPGRVLYAGQGDVLVGGTPHQLASASVVGRLLRNAGLRALGVPDIRGHLWLKAIINACINPLTALHGVTNGALLEDPALVQRMKLVAAEATTVARALKVPLPERDPFTAVHRVAQATAENRSSMMRDLERGRRTEIDAINGAIVEHGKRLGIPTPENEALWRAIKAREGRA